MCFIELKKELPLTTRFCLFVVNASLILRFAFGYSFSFAIQTHILVSDTNRKCGLASVVLHEVSIVLEVANRFNLVMHQFVYKFH